MADDVTVAPGIVIPERELRYRFSTSGGPGGQHANRAATRVELVFDVAASEAFDDATKKRLLERLASRLTGTTLVIGVDESRSQWRNRAIARRRLADVLREATRTRRRRLPSRPTRASRERRLTEKRAQSAKKSLRKRPDVE